MVKVCALHIDTFIKLEEFETESEAKEFMKHDYVLAYADEVESNEDIIIHPDEMFIQDDNIPFYEPLTQEEIDMLPF